MEFPKVSVIIPVYNGERFLSEAIESVINQTYPNWEIIAINDGSTDRSMEILKHYKSKLSSLIHVINQENLGPSVARNSGIKKAKGEYIAFLDYDDLWLSEKLEKQVKFLESNNEISLIYCDCYIIDNNSNIEKDTYSEKTKFIKGKIFKKLLSNNFIPTSTVLLRKKVLDDVGLFNLEYKISQDYDLWLRISDKYLIDFLKQPLAKYRFHSESISKDVKLMTNEDFQILKYWLNKKPELKMELKDQIKSKIAHLYYQTVLYYYHNHKIKKAIKEFIKWFLCICNLSNKLH